MIHEYLPILERIGNDVRVIGKMDRQQCHGKHPAFHGTAIIAAILPDGRLLLADKTAKQQKKRAQQGLTPLPAASHIYDIFGGHMRYDDIPQKERESVVSLETFRKCALRELSEELLVQTPDGGVRESAPDPERLLPLGFYELANDHNREYTWAFAYPLPDFGPYDSRDSFLGEEGEELLRQPLRAVDWEELLDLFYRKSATERLSDAIGRILSREEGSNLHKTILKICGN